MRIVSEPASYANRNGFSAIQSLNFGALQANCVQGLKKNHYYPLVLNFLSDFETPLSLCHKLKASFLLESVEMTDSIGRYSIVASGIREKIEVSDHFITYEKNGSELPEEKVKSKQHKFTSENPLNAIQQHYLKRRVASTLVDVPPFCGGLIGYTGFEAAQYFEKIKASVDVLKVPDVVMIFPQLVAVYDNVRRMVSLIYLVASPFFLSDLVFEGKVSGLVASTVQKGGRPHGGQNKKELTAACEESFKKCYAYLQKVRNTLEKKVVKLPKVSPSAVREACFSWKNKKSNCSKKKYMKMVEQGKKHIYAGDVFQVVLSQRFSFPCSFPPFEIYRNLRRLNPSPYMYYLNFGSLTLVGSSPETMATLSGEEVSVLPLAGTAARGKTTVEDAMLAKQLLENEKELAEHLMLVDLGRNDLGRIAKPGTIEVKRYMEIEKYSHVQHIVSKIIAQRKKNINAIDLMRATFPAGTLSGAPKVRAMEIIADLEKEKRGPYGGMVFYWSLSGNFDSCITIRTLLVKNNMGYVQAGAGVVYDSDPAAEYEECLKKSQAVFRAVQEAGQRCSI